MTKRERAESSGEAMGFVRAGTVAGRNAFRGQFGEAGAARIVGRERQSDEDRDENAKRVFKTEGNGKLGADEFGESHASITCGEREGGELEGGFHVIEKCPLFCTHRANDFAPSQNSNIQRLKFFDVFSRP